MERDPEILNELKKLDKTNAQGNAIYQQLFDFHKINVTENTKRSKVFDIKIDGIISALNDIKTTNNNSLAKLTKNELLLGNISSILRTIDKSITTQTSVLGSMIAATSGQTAGVSSLKGLEKQTPSASLGKLDNAFKSTSKNSTSKKDKSGKSINLGGLNEKDMKTITSGLKNMGNLLIGFVQALKQYAKIQDKVDAEGLVSNVVNIVTKISDILLHKKLPKKEINKTLLLIAKGLVKFIEEIGDIKRSKIKNFTRVVSTLSGGFGKLLTLLDNLTEKPERYENAIEVFGSIIKAIRKMQVSFIVAALMFPLIPFAMVTFFAIAKIANSVGWFGMFGVHKILNRGASTLSSVGTAILKMTLSFWMLGRIMKKYDVPGILDTIKSAFSIFETIIDMEMDYKKADRNIQIFGDFLQALTISFVSFRTISALLKKYKPDEITGTVVNMHTILTNGYKLFDDFSKFKSLNPDSAEGTLGALHVFFGGLPELIKSIGNTAAIVKKEKLDARAKSISTTMGPVMDLMRLMIITELPKMSAIVKLKITFLGWLKFINTVFTVLGVIGVDGTRVKSILTKVNNISSIFAKVFEILKSVADNYNVAVKSWKTIKYIAKIGFDALKMATTLALLAPMAPFAILGVMFIAKAVEIFKITAKRGIKDLMKFAMALTALSPAIILFAGSLVIAGILFAKLNIPALLIGFATLYVMIKTFQILSHKPGMLAKGALALMVMSAGIVIFGASLMLFNLALRGADMGQILLGSVAMLAYGIVIGLIGVLWTTVLKGSLAVIVMGVALALFSVGLLIFGVAVNNTSVGVLLMGAVVLLAYGVVFALIGAWEAGLMTGIPLTITIGSIATIVMGLALIAFGFGLSIFMNSVNNLDPMKALVGALVIIGFGISFAIVGALAILIIPGAVAVFAMSFTLPLFLLSISALALMPELNVANILKVGLTMLVFGIGYSLMGILSIPIIAGAVAITAMALSLPIFIASISSLALMPELNIASILKVGLTMLVFGIGYSLIGVLSIPIAAGAFAITAISLSLPLFLLSLSSLKMLSDVEWGSIAKLGVIMAGMGVGYAAMGVVAPFIAMGAFSVTAMALSLKVLTNSLQESLKLDWKKFPIDDISNVLLKLTTAFALVGSDGKTGFSGFITGIMNAVGIGPNNVKRGVDTVLHAGKALTSISEGLMDFNNKMKDLDLTVDQNGLAKSSSFLEKMGRSITSVSEAFGAMGVKYPSSSFFGLWTLDKSAIQKGIESTLETGKALTSISEGLLAFDEKTKGLFGADGGTVLMDSIKKTIGMISASFSGIASDNVSIFGINIIKSNIQKGIESVKDVGKTFYEIAEGLKFWSNLKSSNIDTEAIAKNVTSVITTISNCFSDIGKTMDSGFLGTGLFASTDAEKGIESVKGVGKVFGEIAEGLKSFSSLEKLGFKSDSFNPTKKGSIAYNMLEVVKATGNIFSELGRKGNYEERTDMNGVKTKVWVYDQSIQKGIESVKGVGDILSGIANGLKTFGTIDDMKLPKIKENVKDILSLIASVFGEIGSGKVTLAKAEDVAAGVKAVSGVGKELELISKSLVPYMDLQKDKKIDTEVLKKNIKDIVSGTLIMFGSIGLIQNGKVEDKAFLESQFGSNYWAMRIENIKSGAETMKAGIDGMDFIQKAADVFKKVNEEFKSINLDSTLSNIKKIILTGLSPIGALGIAQEDKNSKMTNEYFGKDGWLLNNYWISKGKTVLENVKDMMSSISGITEVLNKKELNVSDWESKKQMIIGLIKSPIESLGNTVQTFGYDNILKWLTGLVPSLKTNLNDLLTTANKSYDGSIGGLTKDLKDFIKDVVTSKIDKKHLESMDKIVQFFERWSKIDDPFSKFAKTFKAHLGDFKEYVREINNIDVPRITAFTDLNYKTTELVKLDPTQVATNASTVKDLIMKVVESTKNTSPSVTATTSNSNDNTNNLKVLEGIKDLLDKLVQHEMNEKPMPPDTSTTDNISALRRDVQALTNLFKDGSAQVRTKTTGRK